MPVSNKKMKIIKVSGCHDCPVIGYSQNPIDLKPQTECMHDSRKTETIVTDFELKKTISLDCPLEDEL